MAQVHIENDICKEYQLVMDEPVSLETDNTIDYNIDSNTEEEYKYHDVDVEATIQYNAYVKNELEKNYPINYVIIHSILLFVLNVALMIIQVVAIQNNAAFSEFGLGIWVGFYNLITVVLALLTIKYRNETLISWTATMNLFGMMVSFGGFIFVNMIAIYNYNCIVATYSKQCYNVAVKPIHFVFIVLGTPSAILSLVFFIYLKLKTKVGRPV